MDKKAIVSKIAMAASALMLSASAVVPAHAATISPTDIDDNAITFQEDTIVCGTEPWSTHTCDVDLYTHSLSSIHFVLNYSVNDEGAATFDVRYSSIEARSSTVSHESITLKKFEIADDNSHINVRAHTWNSRSGTGNFIDWTVKYVNGQIVIDRFW
ncbi:hypothetical protein D2E26_0267 [Bifidobacterium dolichotidis]|uniref:Uncharacterized protein n=1 Tax=Bifidobacterium dolichotidis TaxID=2306976 RepID=A0A430FS50_9BIFI|nr:hypothetical protein [Bifidobacterium dolichotidis]RSX55704.1 hypothetical protein D2E26_0267 [Bifidobacterium dolichotidis]